MTAKKKTPAWAKITRRNGNSETYHLGHFKTLAQAAKAFEDFQKRNRKGRATLHIPTPSEEGRFQAKCKPMIQARREELKAEKRRWQDMNKETIAANKARKPKIDSRSSRCIVTPSLL